jgi:hypothetical protein
MTPQDIEAELSYAYLHAVAAKAAVACQYCSRTFDSTGVDAQLKVVRDFGPGALTELTVEVQLKATIRQPGERLNRLAYFLADIGRYNRLRAETIVPPRVLVVLFLPEDAEEWLRHTDEQLVLKRCAYWVSLKGAPESANDSGQTIYIPRDQVFSPEGLTSMLARLAQEEDLRYEP